MINSFLLIGQSNMAGRGSLQEVAPIVNKDVLMFRADAWVEAMEPLHEDKPELAGVGLAMSFADTLQKKYNKQIGLIPCAFGGTSLSQWQAGGELYTNAVETTGRAVKSSVLKGILWHQGEGDATNKETAESYKERFLSFIQALLQDLGCEGLPVVLGALGEYLEKYHICAYFRTVNEQLKDIAGQKKWFSFCAANGLIDKGDLVHFNAVSLREFGIRYAASWDHLSRILGVVLE